MEWPLGDRQRGVGESAAAIDTSEGVQALGMRWSRNAKEPFNIVAYYDRDLRYTARFEIVMSITRQNTIGFRAYPVPYLNLDDARDPVGLLLAFVD